MTILDLIKAACKTKGVPEKYAERIQKTFKVEKAEGLEAFVDIFKDNLLPAIQEAENEAKKTAEEAAVTAYEEKHKLKDGKPVEKPKEEPTPGGDLLKGLSPEVKAYMESIKKSVEDVAKKVDTTVTTSANEAKKDIARKQMKDVGLPDAWIGRVDVLSTATIEEQVKILSDEYNGIRQTAIDEAVSRGDYTPGNIQMSERSEADWAKLMNGEETKTSNPGVVNLGIE